MSKKNIKPIEFGILKDGYTRIAVDLKDCPRSASPELEIYGDQNGNKEAILTHHCYDTQPNLRPVIGSVEVKCPHFGGYHHGHLYCESIKS